MPKRTPFFMTLFVLFAACPCLAQRDFQDVQRQRYDRNPPGVKVSLRTTDGRLAFHLFETIPIELVFQSSLSSRYSIELDEDMNFAGQSNWFEVFPSQTVFLPSPLVAGVICCATNRQYLSPQSVVLKRELTDYMRFASPGTYSIFYSTNRVFRGLGKRDDFNRSPLMITSNVLTLTILPDDPEWDERRLADTIKNLEDPRVRARYESANRKARTLGSITISSDFYYHNHVYQTELVKAQKALNAIDTEAGIRERIRRMHVNSPGDINLMRKSNTASSVHEPQLSSTTRPDLVVASMQERAEMPEFGVDYNYVATWSRFLVQREHPELFRRTEKTQVAAFRELASGYSAAVDAAKREITEILQSNLASKKGDELDLTTLTLKIVTSELRPQ